MNRLKLQFISLLFILIIPGILYSQQDPIRIACVGNSITEGIALTNPAMDSYPVDLGRFLGSGYNVRNFGKSGTTMLKKGDFPLWNEQVFSDAISFDPNIVIIMLGTNDSKPQNWAYKDEFLTDYCAMIDTFRQGSSNPEIFICYPLPAFSGAYDIRDTIISNDIIPIISHIVDSLNLNLIDFYSAFLDKGHLLPDGIHPLIEGSEVMAKIVYEKVTGKAIVFHKENNLASNKKAVRFDTELTELIDRDEQTAVTFNSDNNFVVIDLLSQYQADMIQIHFTDSSPEFSFRISISSDSITWNTVADTTLSASEVFFNFFAVFPVAETRYVRFEIPEDGLSIDSSVTISELQVFEAKPFHAPALSREILSASSVSNRIKLRVRRSSKIGEFVKIYKQSSDDSPFELAYNYRSNDLWELTLVMPFGMINRFYAVAYYDGVEVQSDTLTIISSSATGVEDNSVVIPPSDYYLSQNYPNPFNPETVIEFSIPSAEFITIEIFDNSGKLVRTIANNTFSGGTYRIKWDGKNSDGKSSASGVYYYRLKAADRVLKNKKMILLR